MSLAIRRISFSGAGWLFPWHVGVFEALLEAKLVRIGETKLMGVSGGSLAALSGAFGLGDVVLRKTKEIAKELKDQGYLPRPFGTTDKLLSETINLLFRDIEDVHIAAERNRLHVGVTELETRYNRPRFRIDSKWESEEALCSSLRASCFIPMYGARGRWYLEVGDTKVLDGGIFDLCPVFPNEGRTLRVSCFPTSPPIFGTFDICPTPEKRTLFRTWRDLLKQGLDPDPEKIDLVHQDGYKTGQQFAENLLIQQHQKQLQELVTIASPRHLRPLELATDDFFLP